MSLTSIIQTFQGCQRPAPRQSRFLLLWQTHHPQHLLPCSPHGSALHMHPRAPALRFLLWVLLSHRCGRKRGFETRIRQERSQSRHRLGTLQKKPAPTTPSWSHHPCALLVQGSLDPVQCSCDPRVSPRSIRQLKCKNSSGNRENFSRPSQFHTVFPPKKTKGIFWWFSSWFAPVTQIHRAHGILSMACQNLVIFPIFLSSQTHLNSNY